ncbi:D-beta-hydroxybutyrate dehydrogenase-like [Glandiceps talaboti]
MSLARMSLLRPICLTTSSRYTTLAVRKYTNSQERSTIARIHHGKVALVTGSSDHVGIGIGIATSLARRGCNVILSGSREAQKVDAQRIELERQYEVEAHYIQADLSDLTSIKKLHDDVTHLYSKGVDILVNNAGIVHVHAVEEFPLDQWERDLRIMLTAPFYLTKLTLPHLKEKGWGRIINISSIFGLNGAQDVGCYVSSKHGLNGLTKVVALETLGSGVTCTSICPAGVNTELLRDYSVYKSIKADIPVEEMEVGELAAFLCSPAADQMTGTTIPIDAGYCAQ